MLLGCGIGYGLNFREAVNYGASGDKVPKPGRSASGQWRQRVPKSLHSRLVMRAEQEGVSLNTLVTAMIAEGLGRRKAS
jgi:antitoxin HicB